MGIQIYTQMQPLPPQPPKEESRADSAPTPIDPAKAIGERPPSFSSYLGERQPADTHPAPVEPAPAPMQAPALPEEPATPLAERRKGDRRQKQIPVLLDTRSYHRRRASDGIAHIDEKV